MGRAFEISTAAPTHPSTLFIHAPSFTSFLICGTKLMGSMAKSEVVLLGWWQSMFVIKAKIALAEKGIQYEYVEEDLPNNKSPLLLKMNPVHKLVPILIHNGKPVCESNIVVQYIDETWTDGSPLVPCDAYLRAQARFWADYIDKKIYEGGWEIWTSEGEKLEKASKEFIVTLKVLEGQLGEKPYFIGETFGFVDIALMSFYSYFFTYETIGGFSIAKECPRLTEWSERCMQRDTVSKSMADPHKFYEITMEARKQVIGVQ